jgi:hypothetical protein
MHWAKGYGMPADRAIHAFFTGPARGQETRLRERETRPPGRASSVPITSLPVSTTPGLQRPVLRCPEQACLQTACLRVLSLETREVQALAVERIPRRLRRSQRGVGAVYKSDVLVALLPLRLIAPPAILLLLDCVRNAAPYALRSL